MKKRLLVVSADAMVCEDLEAIRSLPNYRRYLAGGCEAVQGVRSIYPTVTYPIHVSMITGCYAGSHGVVSNYRFSTGSKEENWNWSKCYSAEDIFSAAKKAGYSTAAIAWPVTGNHPDIDYLAAEYWMPEAGDTLRSSFTRMGTSEQMMQILLQNEKYLPEGYEKGGKKNFLQWPAIDEFWVNCACDLIRAHQPEVLFLHIATFDNYRHSYGVFNSHLEEARQNLDRYLGRLMDACREAGVAEQTNLVLVSDHGQRDICRVLHPNVLLADRGFLRVGPNGEILSWDAFCLSNGMSALIYLRDPEDPQLRARVYESLKELEAEGVYGIGRVFTREEARDQEQLYGDFSFVLESDGYTSFGARAVRPLVQNYDLSDYRYGRATHGYLPEYGPQPVFAARGPDFARNVTLSRIPIVDEAPTYARLLGVHLDADGSPLEAFLRKEE